MSVFILGAAARCAGIGWAGAVFVEALLGDDAAHQIRVGGVDAAVDDVVIGSPIAGRRMQETEGLIGFFLNTLALRVTAAADSRFTDLLGIVKRTALAAQ